MNTETDNGQQVRSNDLLGVIAGFRIERRGIHTIKVWDAAGCQPATPEETLLWDKLIEAHKEIERLETELSQTQDALEYYQANLSSLTL